MGATIIALVRAPFFTFAPPGVSSIPLLGFANAQHRI
jgi:hypothetical protein